MKKYFVFDDETGFDTFSTAEKAKTAAEESIANYRENAPKGWDECVENVCWGEIKEQAIQFDCNEKIEFEGEMVDAVDYKLQGI